jgi:DNA polymerase I-like protein with 3'-5' exonuclease and polymerase domains
MRDAVRAGNTRMPTYAGRVIHLPREYPHKAVNYAVQGTARELLVDALVRWADTRWGRAVLIPVHDELIVHVPEEDGAEATAELIRAMTGELYGIPIVVEADAPTGAWQDA